MLTFPCFEFCDLPDGMLCLPGPKKNAQLVAISRLVVENLLKYGILLDLQTLASYLRPDILVWLIGTAYHLMPPLYYQQDIHYSISAP